jgi:hypothetical protein
VTLLGYLTGHTPAALRDCTRVELAHLWQLAAAADRHRKQQARKRK